MNKEQFHDELQDLIRRALNSDMDPDELMGIIAFQTFAVFLAKAHANADSADRSNDEKE